MGKIGSPWLRGTTGKLAGMVLQGGVTRGETTIRERVVPRDPNTEAQRIQRVIMATAGVAYNRMKAIVDHSFEGKTGAAENMNRFRQLNANMLRQQVATAIDNATPLDNIFAFTPKGSNRLAVNGYVMSEGSLPAANLSYSNDLFILNTLSPVSVSSTYSQVVSALGLQRGDQITFCYIKQAEKEKAAPFVYQRIILEPSSGNMSTAFLAADGSINLPNSRNEGSELVFDVSGGGFAATIDNGVIHAMCVIISRKVNDKWLRSPSAMLVTRAAAAVESIYSYSLEEAITDQSSYIDLPSARYLNNAVTAG